MKTLYILRGLPGSGKTTIALFLTPHSVAADDFPGLYEGDYQISLQKQSHEWCYSQVEEMLRQGLEKVAVHNTFTTRYYLKPYLKLAAKYGYSAHVLHSEDVLLPRGKRTKSTHEVPSDIINSMRRGWEPLTEPERRGMNFYDLALELREIPQPDAIIADMDGTVKLTKSGETFPQTPDDFILNSSFIEGFKPLRRFADLFIVSNQRGISSGQKSRDFLEEECNILSSALKRNGIAVNRMLFATERNSNKYLTRSIYDIWNECTSLFRADKPGTGMIDHIFKFVPEINNFWIVGNAHTQTHSEDWELAQACKTEYPDKNFRYVPVELLPVVCKLI